jgi:hypothetical protein
MIMRRAKAIHVVEKGTEIENLRQRSDIGEGIWETAYWIVGDKTAASLIGGKVFVHRGQNIPSHAGGKIIEIYHEPDTDERRRVIRFEATPDCQDVIAERKGWGNERKIIWQV